MGLTIFPLETVCCCKQAGKLVPKLMLHLTPWLPTPCAAAELENGRKKRLTLSEAIRNDERLAALPPEQVQLQGWSTGDTWCG